MIEKERSKPGAACKILPVHFKKLVSSLLLLCAFAQGKAQQLAFPGAEGFGRFAVGGRGGTVYHVNNLNDSGTGSFRDAVSRPGRTVVFDVSGVIKIGQKIAVSPRITIAGQTAPRGGIIIYGNSVSFKDSTIVRYITFRGSINMSRGSCTVVADDLTDIIFDHVSIEWGRWDNLHIKKSKNLTLQYCIIAESLDPQRFGALLEVPEYLTIHNSLFEGNQSRNPKAKAKIEFINNVVYNWGKSGFVGGHSSADHYQDIVGNYFISGPSSTESFLSMFTKTDHVYHQGNYADLNKDGKLNGRVVTDDDLNKENATLLKEPSLLPKSSVRIFTATQAVKTIMAEAGSSFWRDGVDQRIIGYLKSLGKKGAIFKNETEAGGQGEIKQVLSALEDSDRDGLPDKWEKKNNLDPMRTEDANKINTDGYTNLEKYLNQIVK